MNNKELGEYISVNLRTIFITTICCSVFWIVIGIVIYKYIVTERTKPIDSEGPVMSGFYRREVKLKIDSITNALMIQALRKQLIKKQVTIDSLEKAYMTRIKDDTIRSNRLYKRELELEDHMMFMNLRKDLQKDCDKIDSGLQVLNIRII